MITLSSPPAVATYTQGQRTVHRHVSNIFDKLGVRTRTEAATFAVEHQILRAR